MKFVQRILGVGVRGCFQERLLIKLSSFSRIFVYHTVWLVVRLFNDWVARVDAELFTLLLFHHHRVGGEILAYRCVDESATDSLEGHPPVLAPEGAVDGRRLPHEHPHLLERRRAPPLGLTLVHDCVVDVIRFNDVEVAPPLEGLLLLLKVTVGRVGPPYLSLHLHALCLIRTCRTVGVRLRGMHNVITLDLHIQQSTVLVGLLVVALEVGGELLVPLSEELVKLQGLDDGVLWASFVCVGKIRPWADHQDDEHKRPEATSLIE